MFSSFLQFFFKFYFCIIVQITIHHFSRAQHLASRFFYGLLFGYCFHLVFLLFTTCCLLLSLLSTHFIHFSFFCANYCVCVCLFTSLLFCEQKLFLFCWFSKKVKRRKQYGRNSSLFWLLLPVFLSFFDAWSCLIQQQNGWLLFSFFACCYRIAIIKSRKCLNSAHRTDFQPKTQ